MNTFKNNYNFTHIWIQIIPSFKVKTCTFFMLWISKIYNDFSYYIYIYIYKLNFEFSVFALNNSLAIKYKNKY